MKKPQLSTPEPHTSSTWERLEDFVREHVQHFIQSLLLGRAKSARREAVDATPGYRNGYGKPRRLTLTSGTITVRRPCVRDLNERFVSRILPLFKRQTKEVGELLPRLYLHGLALGDFELALRGLLGDGAPLSPASLLRLKAQWQGEYETWKRRRLDDLEVVYIWADGLYVKAGLEDTKAALLVMIGVLTNGPKGILAVESGQRESKESWGASLRDLRKRGLKPWRCTIADGHLGLWAALGEQYPTLAEQRCWNHHITNALDAMPKKYQAEARSLLCVMPYAETQTACETLRAEFTARYRKLAPKAVKRLADDWERLVTFYQFPREHWPHLRTSNVVESPFATVRLRTTAAKRFKKVENATALIWKVLQVAESTFRRLKGAELLPAVYAGTRYVEGVARTLHSRPQLAAGLSH
jgi:putative transposase